MNSPRKQLPVVWYQPWPTHSRARVAVQSAVRAKVNRIAARVLGRVLHFQEYADLAGAPDDAQVRVGPLRGMLRLEMVQAGRYGYCGAHLVFRDRFGSVLVCGGYRILDRRLRDQCLALEMFHRQLVAARMLGMRIVLATADRGPTEHSYYTWPRLGFDAALPPRIMRCLPHSLRHARRLLDLMQSETGRRWWGRHGIGLDLAFDLRPGSRCWDVFCGLYQTREMMSDVANSRTKPVPDRPGVGLPGGKCRRGESAAQRWI